MPGRSVGMYGGGEQGMVEDLLAQLQGELGDTTMEMCSAETVSDITDDLVSW